MQQEITSQEKNCIGRIISFILLWGIIAFLSGCFNQQKVKVLTVYSPEKGIKDIQNEFASLAQALEASKKYNECIIHLSDGPHFLDSTVFIDNTISNVTITSAQGGNPIIYGGIKITNWKAEEEFWVADVPGMDFRILEINGRLANRSRLPDTGYFHHLSIFNSNWLSTVQGGFDSKPTSRQLLSMIYKPEDLDLVSDLENVEITLYHCWDETLMQVSSNNTVKHEITFTKEPAYPAGAFGITKYVVWNSRFGMTKPGQWYLDKDAGKVYYYPFPGENLDKAVFIAPVIDELIHIGNTENIRFSNIEFRSNNSNLMVGGFGAKCFHGAVNCEKSKNLSFDNLIFSNLTTNAIKGMNCINATITNCHFHHIGAAGIRFIGSDSRIENNLVHDVGLTYPSTIAIYVNATDPNAEEEWELGKTEGNVLIKNNTVYNAPYVGICCSGHDSKIINNRVSKVVQKLTDGGGIYITFCEKLVLTGNFISDIQNQEGAGTCAYYLDELTSNALVEGNLSINVHRPLHTHLCSNNTIRNNIFVVERGNGLITFPRCENFTLEKNIFIVEQDIEINGLNALSSAKNNILYSLNKGKIQGADMPRYQPINYKAIENSNSFEIDDPGIINYKKGTVEFKNESPAITLGINNIDVSTAGITN